jgi:hypothetical protein
MVAAGRHAQRVFRAPGRTIALGDIRGLNGKLWERRKQMEVERAEVQPFNLPIDGPNYGLSALGPAYCSSSIGPLRATARFLEQGKHGTSQRTLT